MKALFQNKKVKIGVFAICVLIVVLGCAVAAHGSYSRQRVQKHIAAAEKYLLELDYEQAIEEYTLALEADSKNQTTRNALEKVYLDYAQSYTDKDKYDEAFEVLQRGYDQLQIETLKEKTDEVERRKAEKEEAERVQKEQEAQKQAEEEKREKAKQEQEKAQNAEQERKDIYKWEISQIDVFSMIPKEVKEVEDEETDDKYVFMVEAHELIGQYFVEVNKESGHAVVTSYSIFDGKLDKRVEEYGAEGVGNEYDLGISDDVRKTYDDYMDKLQMLDGSSKAIVDYFREAPERVTQYSPETCEITSYEVGQDIFEGKMTVFYAADGDPGYAPPYCILTIRADIQNKEAEITDMEIKDNNVTAEEEAFFNSLIGQKIAL